jgi:hypothetical protein
MSYADIIQINTNEWKVSGRNWNDILPVTFDHRTVAVQVATAINEAYRHGRNDVRGELRSLIGAPFDPEDCQ